MSSLRNKITATVLLATLLLGGVSSTGCNSSSSGGTKDSFSFFQGKKATPKKVEKSGPGTMDEFMGLKRDDRW